MNTFIELHQKFNLLPPNLKREAYLFVDFLIEKSNNNNQKTKRKFGSAKGKIHLSDDFDEPLTDIFKDYI